MAADEIVTVALDISCSVKSGVVGGVEVGIGGNCRHPGGFSITRGVQWCHMCSQV